MWEALRYSYCYSCGVDFVILIELEQLLNFHSYSYHYSYRSWCERTFTKIKPADKVINEEAVGKSPPQQKNKHACV